MTFVVANKRGTFELRESRNTAEGPRSRTLATFRELDDETLEKAQRRATEPLDVEAARGAARRAGAPVARSTADRAARELIAELGKGREPEPQLRRLLAEMLDDDPAAAVAPADPSRAVAEWMSASLTDRGKALVELLLLADALPSGGRRGKALTFPRLESASV